MLKTLRNTVFLAGFTAGMANAQEPPPLNTPLYKPDCSSGVLVAQFAFCSVQMVPIATMSIDGVPAMAVFTPKTLCRIVGVNSEEALNSVGIVLPGPPDQVQQLVDQARKDFQEPSRSCPALAMF